MSTVSGHSRRKGGRPKVLNAQQTERVVYWYRRGEGVKSIARRFGVVPETVRKALIGSGVKLRRRGRPGPPVDPVWGRLAHIMYAPRSPDEPEQPLPPGHKRLDLGGEQDFRGNSSRKVH